MKVLKMSQDFFMWLGINPIEDQTSHRQQMLYNLYGSLAVMILGSMIVTSLVCAFNYGTAQLNDALYASFPGIAAIRVFTALVSMIIFRREITTLFINLQTFNDQNEFPESVAIFEKANKSANKTAKILTINVPACISISRICMAAISVVSCYVTRGYVHADYLFVPLKFALPWNKHTVVGWIAEIAYIVMAGGTYFTINSLVLTYFIGISLYFLAFYKHFAVLVTEIDNSPTEFQDLDVSPAVILHNNDIHAKAMLRKTIQFHVMVIDIFSVVADMFNATVFFLIFCAVGFSSISIFQLDLAVRNKQSNVVLLFFDVLAALSDAAVFCYFGAMTTYSLSDYVDRLYEVHWYKLPVTFQKQLIIIMANLQRPLRYQGFGMVKLSLVTFVQIIKTVASFYLAFKTINA